MSLATICRAPKVWTATIRHRERSIRGYLPRIRGFCCRQDTKRLFLGQQCARARTLILTARTPRISGPQLLHPTEVGRTGRHIRRQSEEQESSVVLLDLETSSADGAETRFVMVETTECFSSRG